MHTYIPYHTIPYHTIPYHTIPYHTYTYTYVHERVSERIYANTINILLTEFVGKRNRQRGRERERESETNSEIAT